MRIEDSGTSSGQAGTWGRRLALLMWSAVVLGAGAGFAATLTVSTTADSGAGSLRQAVADAVDGDRIEFSVQGTIALSSGEIVLDKTLDLIGPGAELLTIDGGGASRVLRVSDDDPATLHAVRIEKLTLANGSVTGSELGGCILNAEGLTLVDSVVRDSNTEAQGGGIYNLGGEAGSETGARLSLLRTSVIDNVAGRGGGLFNDGGFADQSSGSEAMISDSLFEGNFSQRGGAIFNDGGQQDDAFGATMEIFDTTVQANAAQIQGGGIYNDGGRFGNATGAVLTVVGSEILSNRALQHPSDPGNAFPGPSAEGGGIYNDGSWLDASGGAELLLVRTTIANNSAGDYYLIDGVWTRFTGFGGGIYNDRSQFVSTAPGGSVTIRDSSITDNTSFRSGGGVLNAGQGGLPGGTFEMENVLVARNWGFVGGGVMNIGKMQLTNVTIARNASVLGGALYSGGPEAELRMSHGTVAGNGRYTSGVLEGGTNAAFQVDGGTAWIKSSIFVNPHNGIFSYPLQNCALDSGGVIVDLGYNLADDFNRLPADHCPFDASTSDPFADPRLDPAELGNHGGWTQTWPTLPTSPALDAIPAGDCTDAADIPAPVMTDQRGLPRPAGGGCDIGAFEWQQSAPIVTQIDSAPSTAGGLSEGEPIKISITQLAVAFDQNVVDPAGSSEANDVTNPASYLLVEGGQNGSHETDGCGGVTGDDNSVMIDSVAYDTGTHTATLTLNGGALPGGSYRLFVCGTIENWDKQQLDGDGDGVGGDDFLRSFTVRDSDGDGTPDGEDGTCSGTDLVISSAVYEDGETIVCTGSTSLRTFGLFVVGSGADVTLISPSVSLGSGTTVAGGGSLQVGN